MQIHQVNCFFLFYFTLLVEKYTRQSLKKNLQVSKSSNWTKKNVTVKIIIYIPIFELFSVIYKLFNRYLSNQLLK